VSDPEVGAEVAPCEGAVAGPIVGQNALHVDSSGREPGDGTSEKGDAVDGGLGPGELAVGEPRVRVDRGVDMGVAGPGRFLMTARPSMRWP
jgi:hypothetical protein